MKKQGAHVLVVDDEVEIIRALQRSLAANGYKVLIARTGEEAIQITEQQHPDIVLLDLMLPTMSGLEVCQRIRAVSSLPIIVLSVKNAGHEKIEALDMGADDYITKPFGINEVLARIRVALRHAAQTAKGNDPLVQIGTLQVDFALRRVQRDQQEIVLTPTEYDLLKTFITHRGKILTRQQLLQLVWGSKTGVGVHNLHVYVAQLRRKLEPIPEQPRFLLTVPGVGYRFSDEPNGEGIPTTLRQY